jgi:hypothetical protein
MEQADEVRRQSGDRMLAIPNNASLSHGPMFEPVDFAGKPLSSIEENN